MNKATYGWRKLSAILIVSLSALILIFLILQIISFYDFANNEEVAKKKYLKDYKLVGYAQKNIFNAFFSIFFISIFSTMIFGILSIIGLYGDKYNGDLFFRTTTWVLLMAFICAFVMLAIKPSKIEFREIPGDKDSNLIVIAKPIYSWTWTSFIIIIFLWLSSILCRKNFSYLRNNINIIKYKNFMSSKIKSEGKYEE